MKNIEKKWYESWWGKIILAILSVGLLISFIKQSITILTD